MRTYQFIIAAVLCLSISGIKFYTNENSGKIVVDKNNSKESNGIITYNDVPLTGTVEAHTPDGKIKSSTDFSKGIRNGREVLYFPDGSLYTECTYVKNKMDGRYTGYYNDGRIKFNYNYSDGNKNGECTDYFELGQPGIVKNYDNGIETGEQKEWRRNGRLIINYSVRDGRKYGLDNESEVCESIKKDSLWQ